jgi:hypothetical protein
LYLEEDSYSAAFAAASAAPHVSRMKRLISSAPING